MSPVEAVKQAGKLIEERQGKVKEVEEVRLHLMANVTFAAGKKEAYEEMLGKLTNGHKEGKDGNTDSPKPTA